MAVLEGRIAVVTGAGRGIGREIALDLARQGARVIVNDLGGEADGSGAGRVADDVAEEIGSADGVAVANHDSVATVAGGEAIIGAALEAFGGLDILVNNAGILRDRTIFKMTEQDWDAVMAVHLKGHFCCTAPYARYIRETGRQGCRIINFSSISGLFGNFGQSNYGAAKSGIAGFSRVLALELAKYGCTVNTISPGAVTRLTIDLLRAAGREVDLDDPLQGGGPIARVVTWLASPAGEEFTGQIVHAEGGLLGIMQQPAVIRAFSSESLWTQEELDRAMPVLLDAKRAHDEAVGKQGAPEKV